MPQISEDGDGENTRSTLSPDFEFAHEPSIEPPNVEDRRERRGESLWWATFGLTV
jgi:amino acid transporter